MKKIYHVNVLKILTNKNIFKKLSVSKSSVMTDDFGFQNWLLFTTLNEFIRTQKKYPKLDKICILT